MKRKTITIDIRKIPKEFSRRDFMFILQNEYMLNSEYGSKSYELKVYTYGEEYVKKLKRALRKYGVDKDYIKHIDESKNEYKFNNTNMKKKFVNESASADTDFVNAFIAVASKLDDNDLSDYNYMFGDEYHYIDTFIDEVSAKTGVKYNEDGFLANVAANFEELMENPNSEPLCEIISEYDDENDYPEINRNGNYDDQCMRVVQDAFDNGEISSDSDLDDMLDELVSRVSGEDASSLSDDEYDNYATEIQNAWDNIDRSSASADSEDDYISIDDDDEDEDFVSHRNRKEAGSGLRRFSKSGLDEGVWYVKTEDLITEAKAEGAKKAYESMRLFEAFGRDDRNAAYALVRGERNSEDELISVDIQLRDEKGEFHQIDIKRSQPSGRLRFYRDGKLLEYNDEFADMYGCFTGDLMVCTGFTENAADALYDVLNSSWHMNDYMHIKSKNPIIGLENIVISDEVFANELSKRAFMKNYEFVERGNGCVEYAGKKKYDDINGRKDSFYRTERRHYGMDESAKQPSNVRIKKEDLRTAKQEFSEKVKELKSIAKVKGISELTKSGEGFDAKALSDVYNAFFRGEGKDMSDKKSEVTAIIRELKKLNNSIVVISAAIESASDSKVNESVTAKFAKYGKQFGRLFEDGEEEKKDQDAKPADDSSDKDDNKEQSDSEEEEVDIPAVVLTVKKDAVDKCKKDMIDAGVDEDDIEVLDSDDEDAEEVEIKIDTNSIMELKDYLADKGIDLEEKLGITIEEGDDSDSEEADKKKGDKSSDDKDESEDDEYDELDDDFFANLGNIGNEDKEKE